MFAPQPRDRDVGRNAAICLEELRVDDRSNGSVDQIAGDAFEKVQRAGPVDLDLAERAHVDKADPLAKGAVFFLQQVEIGRAREAERALIRACAAPWAA